MIVERGGCKLLYVYYVIGNKEVVFLLKLLPGLFSRSPMFSAKPDFSPVPSTPIIGKNRVRKREVVVVYVSEHSTVVNAEAISRKT